MQPSSIDDVLIATILIGLLLSIANMVISVLNGRTSHRAHSKAASNLRVLYERTYLRTPFKSRRFVSIVRPGKLERRRTPSREAAPRDAAPPKDPD
jgi:hypothetical protein